MSKSSWALAPGHYPCPIPGFGFEWSRAQIPITEPSRDAATLAQAWILPSMNQSRPVVIEGPRVIHQGFLGYVFLLFNKRSILHKAARSLLQMSPR